MIWEYYTLSLQLQSRSHLVCPERGSAYDQGKYQQPLIRSAGFKNFCWTNHTLSFIEILQTNVPIAMWRKLFTLLITCLAKTFFKALSTRRRPSPNIAYMWWQYWCNFTVQCDGSVVVPSSSAGHSPDTPQQFFLEIVYEKKYILRNIEKSYNEESYFNNCREMATEFSCAANKLCLKVLGWTI